MSRLPQQILPEPSCNPLQFNYISLPPTHSQLYGESNRLQREPFNRILRHFLKLPSQKIDQLFYSLDSNSRGYITFEDFVKATEKNNRVFGRLYEPNRNFRQKTQSHQMNFEEKLFIFIFFCENLTQIAPGTKSTMYHVITRFYQNSYLIYFFKSSMRISEKTLSLHRKDLRYFLYGCREKVSAVLQI